jgi:hypothetical protein
MTRMGCSVFGLFSWFLFCPAFRPMLLSNVLKYCFLAFFMQSLNGHIIILFSCCCFPLAFALMFVGRLHYNIHFLVINCVWNMHESIVMVHGQVYYGLGCRWHYHYNGLRCEWASGNILTLLPGNNGSHYNTATQTVVQRQLAESLQIGISV